MCGLTGGLSPGDFLRLQDALPRMTDALRHRGPDSGGTWTDGAAGIAMGHRRLAIVDLSPAGHQPMVSASERWVIAFNGEIYNHRTIRSELEAIQAAPAWRGHSDTETLLAGFDVWGIRTTIERCIGMFAFAVWDRKDRILTLGRDRVGEKPLYYGWHGEGSRACFLFGSDLASLRRHPTFADSIDRDALRAYMRHCYVPAPHSIYQGIYKLPAGCLLSLSVSRPEPVIECYWSVASAAVAGARDPLCASDTETVDVLESLLADAVGQQMSSDVPLGAFLSGGIDSSTIVALMQAQSHRPIRTFSIGFGEAGYNEATHAKAVAAHVGTDHTEMYVTSRQAIDVIPRLPALYSEPFADSSQIPTYLVSELARKHVSVSLSGDAGDELFAGYNRYVLTRYLSRFLFFVPGPARRLVAGGIRIPSVSAWNSAIGPAQGLLPRALRMANVGDKLHKGAGVLGAGTVDELYRALVTQWDPESVVIGGRERSATLRGQAPALEELDAVQRMMVLDSLTYLADDILVKVDRAAMGVSLETRVPFLDHRVVELAWRIPQTLKIRDGVGKWILRQVLYRHVPRALIERPKMGFGVPLETWLRGPLREWAEALLNESRLRQEGFFHPGPIRQKWSEHLSGRKNWQHHLWTVLMFQAWLAENR